MDNRKLAQLFRANHARRRMSQTLLAYLVARRRRTLFLVGLFGFLLLSKTKNRRIFQRSCRRLPRNIGWWELVWNSYSDERFKKTFRISKATFSFILGKVRPYLERKTVNEDPISPECRLGICLYRLARGDYYYTIAEMVGVGTSTVQTIVAEVCQIVVENLWQEHVMAYMPQNIESFKMKMQEMHDMWQFPFCWGAVDGSHIPIKCPAGGAEARKEYYNFKHFYSIVLMAIVDAKNRFIWGSCGYPGNSHDAVILQSTNIWSELNDNVIANINANIGNVSVPPLVVGDSAFPLRPWLLKPYTHAVVTTPQRYFNYRLSRARMVTEEAFGQLKGRWRVLLRKNESSPSEVKMAALACMILHNICIEKEDLISRNLDLSLDPSTNTRGSRQSIRELLHMTECNKSKDSCVKAKAVRNALCELIWKERNKYE